MNLLFEFRLKKKYDTNGNLHEHISFREHIGTSYYGQRQRIPTLLV